MENKSLIPTKEELDVIQVIAKTAHDSKYFDKLGGLPGILCIALYAREVGVSPLVGLMGGFSNVQGKITMSAELMNNMIRRAGHKLQTIRCDNEACEILGERGDTKEKMSVKFTLAEAKAAGLVKSGGAWEKYTSDMLFARCISRLRRRLFPDVATKSYVEGELDDIEIDNKKSTIAVTEDGGDNVTTLEVPKDPLISQEEAQKIENAIGDDEDYRATLLTFFKAKLFTEIPAKKLNAIWNGLNKRQKKLEQMPKEEVAEIL